MEVHQITYFLAIVTERNFGRAAQRCGVSQPSVTRAIHKLERELGGPLLDRARGGVELTRLGRLVLPRLERIQLQIKGLRNEARSIASDRRQVVRLGILTTIDPHDVARLVARAVEADPSLDLVMRCGNAAQLAAEVTDGELDLAFSSRPREDVHSALDFRLLYRDGFDLARRKPAANISAANISAAETSAAETSDGPAAHAPVAHGALWRDSPPGTRPPRISSERIDVTQALLLALGGEALVPRRWQLDEGLERRPADLVREGCDIGLLLPLLKSHSPSIESLVSTGTGIDWGLSTAHPRLL